MNIEERFANIKKEYGDVAERIWREIVKLPNFNLEFLTDDKLFLCITQRGFMSRLKADRLGLEDKSFYKAYFKGLEEGRIAVDVGYAGYKDSLAYESEKRKFWIGIDENGGLTFEENFEKVNPDGYSPKKK